MGIPVWGNCRMPTDSLSTCSNTFAYVCYGCRKQFELASSLNHEVMTSFWLHKWPRTSKSDPSKVGMIVWGNCHMPMDSISIYWSTLYMFNVDARSSLRRLSATMTLCHHFDSTQVTQSPEIWPKWNGYNCLRLLPYDHEQYINGLKPIVCV